MADTSGPPPAGATFEFIQNQAAQARRTRPPLLDLGDNPADRVPLRSDADSKLRRRESRLGLGRIFGWGKTTTPEKTAWSPALSPATMEAPQRSGGIRASLAELNWPYGLQNGTGQRSEVTLPSLAISANSALKHKKSASGVRGLPSSGGHRGSVASWDPPPLFKAYPQAIKHAHLSACTASADTVLRLHGSKNSLALDTPEMSGVDKNDRSKKKHRRNTSGSSALKLDWTTKAFVLVTSGHLLQYSGDGPFDRFPEKILQLGKDSAAFASDVLPGCHWVIQVSSVVEPERAPASHASSLLSRFPFRGHERKHTSNLLMVFGGAEEMDSWITVLRREIESLGGRKYLSETGRPKVEDPDFQLRSQPSQRTLVVRDPERYSRVISPEPAWGSPTATEAPERYSRSFDDTSTASGISHDGRQLDRLRDSTNRLSFISSGQRTVITSAGSSPACSPTRDSFAPPEDVQIPDLPLQDDFLRPRARPNAAAINDRRQSMQTMNHVFELRVASAQMNRPHSTHPITAHPDYPLPPLPNAIPNFSVPQGMAKRYSHPRAALAEPVQTTTPIIGRMASRRQPPTALAINGRPLSLVEDQPSPMSPPLTEEDPLSPSTVSTFSARVREPSEDDVQEAVQSKHRRRPSASSTRSLNRVRSQLLSMPDHFPLPPPSPISPPPQDIRRPKSSLDFYARAQSPVPLTVEESLRNKRFSCYSGEADKPKHDSYDPHRRARPHSLKPVPRSSQHLRVDSLSKALLQRRSLSQLAEGPPPAPPPNRALPPLPPRKSSEAGLGRPFRPTPPGYI
ncbi:hypothetical protein B0T18DRAFT_328773 [Schizothecium vesticola]|uniref:PH domain-containing protein n=1 Tax=Schizothecium vesticola TaxID=314040 RepID=A0AA40K2X5_9PEZI|nr:hypothetical protein B0T18DRAFT_328773 [Schizothecium vesticola]